MKRITLLTLICAALSVQTASAQGSAKEMEREVKISGNYYYGDGTAKTEEAALELAAEELKLMIAEDVMQQEDGVDIDFQGFEENIGTLVIPLQGRVRAITFVQKKEVRLDRATGKKLMVRSEEHPSELQ